MFRRVRRTFFARFGSLVAGCALVTTAACEATSNLGFNTDAAPDAGVDDGAARAAADASGGPMDASPPDAGEGDGATRDGADDGGDGGPYPFGYACDPIANLGCGAIDFCLLTWPASGGPAVVRCVPKSSRCNESAIVTSGHPLCAYEEPAGTFVRGGVCREVSARSAFCLGQVACDLTAPTSPTRGCPANRVCSPIGSGGQREGYGHCDRAIPVD